MSYKHGDWYCKPESEAEAKEIVERAIASGARELDGLDKFLWDFRNAWGVNNSYTRTADSLSLMFEYSTRYTIDELRKKFLLPGEREKEPKQWRGPEDGMQPVGWHGECNWLKNDEWFECVVLTGGKVAHKHRHSEGWVIGDCELLEFRPLRTEREKWVEAAARIPKPCGLALVPVLEQIYDAMQSGELKAPEVSDAK